MKKQVTKISGMIIALSLVVFTMSGCGGSKTAITGDTFMEKLAEKGYKVTQIDSATVLGDDLNAYYTATISDGSSSIRFMVAKDQDGAQKHYESDKSGYESYKPSDVSEKKGQNYIKYEAKVDSQRTYIDMTRVDNTYLSAIADQSKKDDLDNLLDELGY